MRLRLAYPIALAAAAVALLAPGSASAATAAGVHVKSCQTGSQPSQRKASFHAEMRSIHATSRMALRFDLIQHVPGADAEAVSAPRLRSWRRSRPGVTRFGHLQKIKGLDPGTSYRVRVQFRWYDASGRVIKKASRSSGWCNEDGDLPNLSITAVKISPGAKPGTALYTVSVANEAKGVARDFDVALIVDGALADRGTVDRLEGGETASVKLNGPTCHRLRTVVDADDTQPETVEEDNVFRSRC